MNSYFSVDICLGPFSGLTEPTLYRTIDVLVDTFGPTEFSDLCENFSFGESILEAAAQEVGEEVVWSDNSLWQDAVRRRISDHLRYSALQVYLADSNEATQRIIGEKSYIISGGQTWDGHTTDIADHIKFVNWSKLDLELARLL